jgi:hypothetical protein
MSNARATRQWTRQLGQLLAAVPLFLVSPLLRPWHIRWGATDDEVSARMPGDDLVPGCQYRTTRVITINADRRHVWPWLVQVGVGRAGFYSVDLLDNLARPSAAEILPEHQRLSVGAWVPMPPTPSTATAFTVHSFNPERVLVWAKPDSTWVWRLTANADGSTSVGDPDQSPLRLVAAPLGGPVDPADGVRRFRHAAYHAGGHQDPRRTARDTGAGPSGPWGWGFFPYRPV